MVRMSVPDGQVHSKWRKKISGQTVSGDVKFIGGNVEVSINKLIAFLYTVLLAVMTCLDIGTVTVRILK